MTDQDLRRSQVTSGVGAGTALNAKLKNAFGVPYAYLTEKQWKEIQEKAALRGSARFELNIALRRYWLEHIETTVSPAARAAVAEAKIALKNAFELLVGILLNDDVFKGRVTHYRRTPLQERAELEATCESLASTGIILSAFEKRLTRGRGGPSYGPLYDLILATDTPLEYIWTVIKVAHLKVSKNTVDTVLKNYITDRDEHDRAFPQRVL